MTPKQFWRVADVYINAIIIAPSNSMSFLAASEGFQSLGRWIAHKDPRGSLALFCDFALTKMTSVLANNPLKRLGILKMLHAFSPNDIPSHIQCIKRLQAVVPNITDFIHCLTILATQESTLDASLLDLYVYYASIGLSHPSPKLRAGALAVLSTLLSQNGAGTGSTDIIIALVPTFIQLSRQDMWWEIQAHLLTLAGGLLELCGGQQGREPATEQDALLSDSALEIVNSILTVRASACTKQWGLVALAASTSCGEPVTSIYVNTLLALAPAERAFLLGLRQSGGGLANAAGGGLAGARSAAKGVYSKRIPLPASSGIPFVLEPVTFRW